MTERSLSARQVLSAIPPGWVGLAATAYVAARNGGGSITDIKSKYGWLSVYADTSAEAQGAIRALEVASGVTCEVCGRYAELREDGWGWMRTLCDQHAQMIIQEGVDWSTVYISGRYSEGEVARMAERAERMVAERQTSLGRPRAEERGL